ncbi:ABC transporter permease [Streptantibioticus cattleyicolor]|uniref:ABC-2 type transporter n=1 Tax=Streptantibioticus cattleyicolor (strain ATCC 35852 / DSM 46488 / JCM 4925 / NBRC 14057 / NRRL 8057) TaxID=1003195 RepID=F8JJD1_STREN|nr:ABC transporter permease [Streptantibioticus cattleyicolor]AEW98752.1 ABC-2 type transporter [Streptantibioticus cattleyicolor NRRL 8057 = DSM 46488]CCB72196.1 Putative transporter ABC superfamily, permease subunit [Streptantibioticus cattleyicolor NRRL 8057 = DSM 46488]
MTAPLTLPPLRMTRRGFRTLTAVQAKLLLREPAALIWLLLPVVLLVIFGNIPGFLTPQTSLHGKRVIDAYVPTLAAMVPLFLGCTALPMTMAGYREKDVLRRLSVSPVPARGLLAALVTVIAALAVADVVVMVAIGVLAFDVTAPADPAAVLASFLLGGAAVLALGLMVAAVARNSGIASALGVPMMVVNFFFSGLYFPLDEMPRLLRAVGEFVPFGAVMDAWAGYGPLWRHLLVLAAWTVLGSVVASRTFRWE